MDAVIVENINLWFNGKGEVTRGLVTIWSSSRYIGVPPIIGSKDESICLIVFRVQHLFGFHRFSASVELASTLIVFHLIPTLLWRFWRPITKPAWLTVHLCPNPPAAHGSVQRTRAPRPEKSRSARVWHRPNRSSWIQLVHEGHLVTAVDRCVSKISLRLLLTKQEAKHPSLLQGRPADGQMIVVRWVFWEARCPSITYCLPLVDIDKWHHIGYNKDLQPEHQE